MLCLLCLAVKDEHCEQSLDKAGRTARSAGRAIVGGRKGRMMFDRESGSAKTRCDFPIDFLAAPSSPVRGPQFQLGFFLWSIEWPHSSLLHQPQYA